MVSWQDNLRSCDKEILQDLWKVRTGIHEIREIHRKQLEAEQMSMDANYSTPRGHRQLRRTSGGPSDSPTSPTSPLSPPPSIARLSASVFNLKDPPSGTANSSDNSVLESFFGTDNMSKLKDVLWQSTDSLTRGSQRKSQSTEKLLSSDLPPLPEKKRSHGHRISRSPKNSLVHASTPDMSSLRRYQEPVSDVGLEMQKLRMRLRETANQTVAELEEQFSPKFNRLTLGPSIDLPPNHSGSGGHSHQGSLDSFPSPIPSTGRLGGSSSGHGRQRSLPASAIGQTKLHSAHSPPKSPSPVAQPAPHSRSPTPPHQQSNPHARHPSLSSSNNISGLITTCYQNQLQDNKSTSYNQHHQRPSQPYEVANGIGVGSHKRPSPPSMSRQYSPSTQQGVIRTGGMGHPSSEQTEYIYTSGRSNGGRVYTSNPNLLSGGGGDSSTHYSTAVIKKRRSSGTKNEPQNGHYGGETHEYDVLQSAGYTQYPPQPQSHAQGSNHSHHMGRTHSPNTQYTQTGNVGKTAHHPPNSYHNQRSVPPPTSETDLKQSPRQIKPYMSTGELRASMRQFQYVPFAEQKRSLALGRGHNGQNDPENTWL